MISFTTSLSFQIAKQAIDVWFENRLVFLFFVLQIWQKVNPPKYVNILDLTFFFNYKMFTDGYFE